MRFLKHQITITAMHMHQKYMSKCTVSWPTRISMEQRCTEMC